MHQTKQIKLLKQHRFAIILNSSSSSSSSNSPNPTRIGRWTWPSFTSSAWGAKYWWMLDVLGLKTRSNINDGRLTKNQEIIQTSFDSQNSLIKAEHKQSLQYINLNVPINVWLSTLKSCDLFQSLVVHSFHSKLKIIVSFGMCMFTRFGNLFTKNKTQQYNLSKFILEWRLLLSYNCGVGIKQLSNQTSKNCCETQNPSKFQIIIYINKSILRTLSSIKSF